MRNLLLVAHPDDDTIFCAGTILTNPNDSWHVISMLYNLEDSPRGTEFKNAMEHYKRLGVNLTYQMLGEQDIEKTEGWLELIKSLDLTGFDAIYTHNSEGEYHHPQHVAVNKIVNELFPSTRIYEFICPTMWRLQVVYQPFLANTKVVPLSPEVLRNKLDIYNNNYTSQLENWRNLPDIMRFEFMSTFEIFTYA